MLKSDLEIILQTCNSTEIPPKPNKKEVANILLSRLKPEIVEISFIPEVISSIPRIIYSARIFLPKTKDTILEA